MSNVVAVPYSIKQVGQCQAFVWDLLSAFNAQKWDEGAALIDKKLDKTNKDINTWNIAFDFCRLSKKEDVLDSITSKYAICFNKPPPDWVGSDTKAIDSGSASEGVTLNLISVSTPESEQYAEIHKSMQSKKTALLVKFTPGKPLSWQETAVQRLAAILNEAQKLKIPVFGEHIELPLLHIKKMPADSRTEQDWDVMFFCLKLLNKENKIEEEALNYSMAKGMSPPTYTPFPKADKAQWFSSNTSTAQEDDVYNPVIVLNGAIANYMSNIQNRIVSRLQSKPAVILDMRGLTHIDFTSALELVKLHDKIWSNSRKLYAVEPSSYIVKAMLTLAGWPNASFQTMPNQSK